MAISRTEAQRRYLAKRRQTAREYLGGVCVVCGSTEVLDFDHVDPSTKSIEVSGAIAKHWSWGRLVVELDKCQLLCKQHHVEKSRGEAARRITHGKYYAAYHLKCECRDCLVYRFRKSGRAGINHEPPHGTRAMYQRERRGGDGTCQLCRAANAEYAKRLKERQDTGRLAQR